MRSPTFLPRGDDAALKAAVRAGLPMCFQAAAGFQDLHVGRSGMDRLIKAGVPFHVAADGRQDEHVRPAHAAQRLAQGESVFLVQPHEYMPRLRRWIWHAGRQMGFAGVQARSFLFRVDAAGRPAMAMHDDGAARLLWLQWEGERHVTFHAGAESAQGPQSTQSARSPRSAPAAIARADGRRGGWFRGALKPGTLLYLPPFSPHHVQCRKPSLALSVYWEPFSMDDEAGEWLGFVAPKPPKSFTARSLEVYFLAAAKPAASRRFVEFAALRDTRDGGGDFPSAGEGDVQHPDAFISAWRAIRVLPGPRETFVAAGGDVVLTFPAAAAKVLGLLENYGCVTRKALSHAGRGLGEPALGRLLGILRDEGLIVAVELPAVGAFDAPRLTGHSYSA